MCSEVFDHTSIIRFMEHRFGVREPNVSPWRRAVCGDLTSAFDFSRARTTPAALPSTAGYAPKDRERHPDYVPKPPAVGALPRQEPGTRPARPLRYAPFTDAVSDASTGRITLTFGGGAEAGAQFLVTSGNRTDGPWTYTAEAGKQIADTWNSAYSHGVHDLTVHGPNGFFRTFHGEGKKTGPEVTGPPRRGRRASGADPDEPGPAPLARHGDLRVRRPGRDLDGGRRRHGAARGAAARRRALVRRDGDLAGGPGLPARFRRARGDGDPGRERPGPRPTLVTAPATGPYATGW
ncbi:hypothetical protein GCM10020221_21990 [Streptomyces thioluteus]|uniref:Bacterial phospholipase C C-terminal domain-containing protein n=1 Tax=Streptomyces thioluteus TaxID=66431 RepID=A0ABN3WUA1_STRTU